MKRFTPALAALALACSQAVAAQTAPFVAGYQVPGGATQVPAQGVQIIGYDSTTGAPCVVGQTATCLLAVSGGSGGGGAVTQSGAWNIGGLTGVGQNNAITRIANTTVYAANQLVCLFASTTPCAPIQVTIAGANAATGTFGRVWLGKTGASLSGATFTIWFFSAAPTTTGMYDHSAYVGPYAADLPGFLGAFTCNAMQATNDATAQAYSECTPNTPSGWVQYQALAGQKYVDALITTTGAYTPTSGEVFTIFANSLQDK